MEIHTKTHAGGKPLKYNLCSKNCVWNGDHKCHARTHTAEASYESDYCEETFAHRVHLERHAGESLCKTEFSDNNAETYVEISSQTSFNLSAKDVNFVEGKQLSTTARLRKVSSESKIPSLREKLSSEIRFLFSDDTDEFISRPYGCGLCAEMFGIEKEYLEHCYNHYCDDPQTDTFLELFELRLLSYVPKADK